MSADSNPISQDLISYLENFKKSITEHSISPSDIAATVRDEVVTAVTASVRNELASTIRAEVTAAVAPLRDTQKEIVAELEDTKDKVSEMVLDNAETKNKVLELQNQMVSIQQRLDNPTATSINPRVALPMSSSFSSSSPSTVKSSLPNSVSSSLGLASQTSPIQSDALTVLHNAKNILGFSPITVDDIAFLKNKLSFLDDSNAMTHSIIEFLNDEMKVPKYITDKLVIKKVFPPSRQPSGWKTLYAEFDNSATTNLINQYVRHLQPGRTVSIYVPHSLFPRFSAIRDLEHSYRNGEIRHKTKIKYGVSDFVLLVKPRDRNVPWSYVSLSSLPPLQLSSFDGDSSSSPPPGRTRLSSKRSRESPETGSNRNNKTRLDENTLDSDLATNSRDDSTEDFVSPVEKPVVMPQGDDAPPVLPLQSDVGAFHPSACVSPSVATNKSFTFTANIPKPQLNLNC